MNKKKLIGKKGQSLFDLWSIVHIESFFLITLYFLKDLNFFVAILIFISLALGWEMIEVQLERHVPLFNKLVGKKEENINRYLGDMIADSTGFILVYVLIRVGVVG